MDSLPADPRRGQTRAEEKANSVSHGIGLVAAFAGAPILFVHAVHHGSTAFIMGSCIFAAAMIFLYLASAIYHALPPGKSKDRFRTIEHTAIFLLIAGTYTPFALGVLYGAWGWTLLGVEWGLAVAGVLLKIFARKRHPVLSTALYLVMGWLILAAIDPLLDRIPTAGFLWLFAGGIAYTVGVAFFATDSRLRYGHFIWHLFVIIGTTCHYFAVLRYAA